VGRIPKIREGFNPYNARDIANDNCSAKRQGVSYGKYKAGIGVDFAETDYPVNTTPFLRPARKANSNGKVVAMIL